MLARTQFLRYAAIGVASNVALYLLYLALTYLGVGHKTAMTSLYVIGVLATFLFNRRWAFRDSGPQGPALARYLIAYALAYVLNYSALMAFVDFGGLPHQAVQAVMILVVAVLMFLAQRHWVFGAVRPGASGGRVS